MIDLKRNSKKELVEATGFRSMRKSIYLPNQTEDFRISRSKFSDFLTCPRCFYLDRVKGVQSPSMPAWSLNETTDHLLKKEFDECRVNQVAHRLLKKQGIDWIVPFNHPDMDDWRDSLRKGLSVRHKDTNIILSGGVDDIWVNLKNNKLIVVDYKSQASSNEVDTFEYLNSPYHEGYKIQMDFYNYLLNEMGFETEDYSIFLVVNANRHADGFNGRMDFSETLVNYSHDTSWVEVKINEMIKCLNSENIPKENIHCENCAYIRSASSCAIDGGNK